MADQREAMRGIAEGDGSQVGRAAARLPDPSGTPVAGRKNESAKTYRPTVSRIGKGHVVETLRGVRYLCSPVVSAIARGNDLARLNSTMTRRADEPALLGVARGESPEHDVTCDVS